MKFLVIFLALASVCQQYVDSKPIHQTEMFKEALKKYMELLKTGDERMGIPKLDPFVYDEKTAKLFQGNPLFDSKNITEYVVRGLSNVIVQDLSINGDKDMFSESIDLVWPEVTAEMKYTHKPEIILGGNGDTQEVESRTMIKDFNIATTVTFKKDPESKAVRMESVSGTRILFDRLEIRGIINKVLPISAVIPGKGSEMTEMFQQMMTPMFDKFMMENANKLMQGVDQEKLKAYLGLESDAYFV